MKHLKKFNEEFFFGDMSGNESSGDHDKETLMMLCQLTLQMLIPALEAIPAEAEREGITPKEWIENNGLNKEVEEVANMLYKIPQDVPGRQQLFDMYEEVIELVAKYED